MSIIIEPQIIDKENQLINNYPQARSLLSRLGIVTTMRAIESDNFVSGSVGWKILAGGTSQLNDTTIIGNITITSGDAYDKLEANLPSDENLVGHWDFNEGTGTDAIDVSGNGNEGTLENMTNDDWVAGMAGTCLDFDGSGDYVDCGAMAGFDFDSNFSLSFWIKGGYDATAGVITKTDAGTYSLAKGFSITNISNPHYLYLWVANGTTYLSRQLITEETYDWTHVVVVRSSDILTCYVDGTSIGTLDITGYDDINGSQNLFLGKGNAGSYNGFLDEVRIYNTALTAAEIYALYKNPAGSSGIVTSAGRVSCDSLDSLSANLGSITAGNITLDTAGYIKGGQTAYNTGEGFFLGYVTDKYKFSIGDPDGKYMTYDGATLKIKGNLERDDFHWITLFESLDSYSTDGTVTVNFSHVTMTTGAVSGNEAGILKSPSLNFNNLTWDKDRKIRTKLSFSDSANQTILMITGGPGTGQHIGFKVVSGVLYGTVGDGSTEATLNCGAIASGGMSLEVKFKTGVGAEFTVDNVNKGTITTNLPTGTSFANRMIYFNIKTNENVAKTMYASFYDFWQAV